MKNRKKGWKAWILYGLIIAGGVGIGVNPAIMAPVADVLSIAVESGLE
ncbi:MAG: hypothetical protein IBX55_15895 [Methyloprofundus sp.]|nr:hypothetical protein [Methyloprofundus sp.]